MRVKGDRTCRSWTDGQAQAAKSYDTSQQRLASRLACPNGIFDLRNAELSKAAKARND